MGHREVVAPVEPGAAGPIVLETARGSGGSLAVDASPLSRVAIAGSQQIDATWVIESAHAGATPRTRLALVAADGLRTVAEEGPDQTGVRYQPGALTWPARARAGDQWRAQGMAVVGGEAVAYERRGRLEPAGPAGCLRSVIEEVRGATRLSWSETRCPGRGVVARDAEQAAPRPPTASGLPAPAEAADRPAPWPAVWRGEARVPHSGPEPIVLQLPVAPVRVAGRLVVANSNSRSLMMLAPIEGEWRVLWRRYPGGAPTAVAAVGQVVLVATSDRRLVAFDAAGRWLWSAPLGDSANVAPAMAWPGVVATVTLDGQLTAHSLATGEQLWRRSAPAGTGIAPVPAGEFVVAVGGAEVVAVDRGGREVWSTKSPAAVKSVASSGGRVFLSTDEGHVMALDERGAIVWGIRRGQACRELHVVGDRVACVDDARVSAYAASDGRAVWQLSANSRGSGTDGRDVLVAGGREVVRVDSHGQVLGRWPERPRVGYGVWVVPVEDGAVVTDATADFTHWRAS